MVKYRKPLAATYRGLLILAVSGGLAFALLSLAMFCFPDVGEPIHRGLMRWLSPRSAVGLDRDDYYFAAGLVGAVAIFWVLLSLAAMLRKPAGDRHIDAHLRAKLSRPPLERNAQSDESDAER